mgnify:CR=1 FL=1
MSRRVKQSFNFYELSIFSSVEIGLMCSRSILQSFFKIFIILSMQDLKAHPELN